MSTVPKPAQSRTYPLGRLADDPRFTLGLVIDIIKVLTGHGFPPITAGGDIVQLQLALFGFLYGPAGGISSAEPPALATAEASEQPPAERAAASMATIVELGMLSEESADALLSLWQRYDQLPPAAVEAIRTIAEPPADEDAAAVDAVLQHRLETNSEFRDGYLEGYVGALQVATALRRGDLDDQRTPAQRFLDETAERWEQERRELIAKIAECPAWCALTHNPADDARDDMALHMSVNHVDDTVRKVLAPHHLEVQVSRLDCPSTGAAGVPNLYVWCELELTTLEQATELARTIVDGFGHLEDAR
jgi:hypothetical protein